MTFFFSLFLSHEAEHFISNCVLLKSREEEYVSRSQGGGGRSKAGGRCWLISEPAAPAGRPRSRLSASSSEAGGQRPNPGW